MNNKIEIIKPLDESFDSCWDVLWAQDNFQHPFYTKFNCKWFREFEPSGEYLLNFSLILCSDGEPVIGLLGMVYKESDQSYSLSCYGKPVYYIENPKALNSEIERARKVFKEKLDTVISEYKNLSIFYWDPIQNCQFSFMGKYLMGTGGVSTPYFTQVIDLRLTEEQLWGNLRKSYKSLINWGKKNLEIEIIDHSNVTTDHIESYRKLHIEVAGRETRSKKSWDVQYDTVKNQEAFLLLAKLEGELVSGVFQLYSSKSCYYGISVSRRELFEKPISHILLWNSIIHAKKMGCCYFELGEQVYLNQANKIANKKYKNNMLIYSPSDKELNIAKFKHGFGGETFIKLDVRLFAGSCTNEIL